MAPPITKERQVEMEKYLCDNLRMGLDFQLVSGRDTGGYCANNNCSRPIRGWGKCSFCLVTECATALNENFYKE